MRVGDRALSDVIGEHAPKLAQRAVFIGDAEEDALIEAIARVAVDDDIGDFAERAVI